MMKISSAIQLGIVILLAASRPTKAYQLSSSQLTNYNNETSKLSPKRQPLTDNTIKTAVLNWVTKTGKDDIIEKHGFIGDWDTSRVTDFSHLFTHARWFNEDLSHWNTSRATDFSFMFAFCSSFRGAPLLDDDNNDPTAFTLQNWDTSRVTSMRFMFQHATQFEGIGLQNWDVSSVIDMTYMFQGASKFSHSLWRWHTAKVLRMNRMFHNATRFSQSLCWHLHPQMIAIQMFCGTNGAEFDPSCDAKGALANEVNQPLHACCECEYTVDDHWYYQDDDSDGDKGDGKDHQLGYILIGLIWSLVFCSMVVVVYVTMKRRHDVQQWFRDKIQSLESTIHGNSDPRTPNSDDTVATDELAPDGGAIATLVGPATTSTDDSNALSPDAGQTASPHDAAVGSDDAVAILLGPDHVQRADVQDATLAINSGTPSSFLGTNAFFSGWVPDSWVNAAATTVVLPQPEPASSGSQINTEALPVSVGEAEEQDDHFVVPEEFRELS